MPVAGLWCDYQDGFARGDGECMMKKLRSPLVSIRDETLNERFVLLLLFAQRQPYIPIAMKGGCRNAISASVYEGSGPIDYISSTVYRMLCTAFRSRV